MRICSVITFGFVLGIGIPAGAQTQTSLERGAYLVNAVMACDGCHTPRGPSGLNMQRRLSGGYEVWDTPAYLVRGSNITPDKETGIGTWSVADLKKALVEGVRPNGIPLAPQMPVSFYKILTPADLEAVALYIASVPSVTNKVPGPEYRKETHHEIIPGADKPIGESVPADPVKRGFYLATLAHCMECHARKPDGTQDFINSWGKGGHEMTGPWGKATVSNITSHPVKGVGAWSDEELRIALTQSIGRDGRKLASPMQRGIYFSKMTAEDLNALVAWVRSIPPIE